MSTLIASNLQASGGTGTAALLASVNGGPISGSRNRIINGDMRIDQRNNNALVNVAPGGTYTIDRWIVSPAGGTVPAQTVSASGLTQYEIGGAAGVTGITVSQRIEAFNSLDLASKSVTLSVTLANSGLTTVNWGMSYANATNNFSTGTIVGSGSWTVTSTKTRYSATVTLPAAAVTGLQISLGVGAQTSGTWVITNVQLEEGTVATPFERRSYGQELALCQRYYEVGEGWLAGYASGAGSSVYCHIPWKVAKRATPTLTYGMNSTSNVSTFDIRNATVNGANWYSAGTAAGQTAWNGTWTASSEL